MAREGLGALRAYFFYGNYGGEAATQGISVARMAFGDRGRPLGKVWKYFEGSWKEPGLGGRQTPIYRAAVDWGQPKTDSFWGPSVHWNTHLSSYVMLLNYSCCTPGWPQAGVYVAFNADLENPAAWGTPEQLLDGGDWYPQVIGTGPREGDAIAGGTARLFVRGKSEWMIEFYKPDPDAPEAGERSTGCAGDSAGDLSLEQARRNEPRGMSHTKRGSTNSP